MLLDVLDKFVDRKPELALFHRMLRGEIDKRILRILDRGEKGKTWFIWRLFHECQERDVPVVLLDFDRDRSGLTGGFVSVVSEVCGYLGDDRTPHVCACAARMMHRPSPAGRAPGDESPGVDWGQGNVFTGADVHTIAGGDIWQANTVFVGSLTPVQAAQHQADMGRALCRDLAALDHAVLLIDTFERAPQDTRAWLERWVLRALCRDLPHVLLVMAGRPEKCAPFFAQPRPWSHLVTAIDELDPFGDDDVLTYYRQCGLDMSAVGALLLALARTSPGQMAHLGDLLQQLPGGARCPRPSAGGQERGL